MDCLRGWSVRGRAAVFVSAEPRPRLGPTYPGRGMFRNRGAGWPGRVPAIRRVSNKHRKPHKSK